MNAQGSNQDYWRHCQENQGRNFNKDNAYRGNNRDGYYDRNRGQDIDGYWGRGDGYRNGSYVSQP